MPAFLLRAGLGALCSTPPGLPQVLSTAFLAPVAPPLSEVSFQSAADHPATVPLVNTRLLPDSKNLSAVFLGESAEIQTPCVVLIVTDGSGSYNADLVAALSGSPIPVYVVCSDAPNLDEGAARRHLKEFNAVLKSRCAINTQEWHLLYDPTGRWTSAVFDLFSQTDPKPFALLVDTHGQIVGQDLFTSYGYNWVDAARQLLVGGSMPPTVEQSEQAHIAQLAEHPYYQIIINHVKVDAHAEGTPSWEAIVEALAQSGSSQNEVLRSLDWLATHLTTNRPNLTNARQIAQAAQRFFPSLIDQYGDLAQLARSGLSGHFFLAIHSDLGFTVKFSSDLPAAGILEYACRLDVADPRGTHRSDTFRFHNRGTSESTVAMPVSNQFFGDAEWGLYHARTTIVVNRIEQTPDGDFDESRFTPATFYIEDTVFNLPFPHMHPLGDTGPKDDSKIGAAAIDKARFDLTTQANALTRRSTTPELQRLTAISSLNVVGLVPGSVPIELVVDNDGTKKLVFKGGFSVLDVCTTHCQPCDRAIPGLMQLHENLKQDGTGTVISIIAEPHYTEDRAKTEAIATRVKYPMVIVPHSELERIGITAFPTFFVLEGNRVKASWIGGVPISDDLGQQQSGNPASTVKN